MKTINPKSKIKQQEAMDLEDQLSCLTADLIEYKKNKDFIKNLFNLESGKWTDIHALCQGMSHLQKQLELIKSSYDKQLKVT